MITDVYTTIRTYLYDRLTDINSTSLIKEITSMISIKLSIYYLIQKIHVAYGESHTES